jgi:PAS domain S-box-containing protein
VQALLDQFDRVTSPETAAAETDLRARLAEELERLGRRTLDCAKDLQTAARVNDAEASSLDDPHETGERPLYKSAIRRRVPIEELEQSSIAGGPRPSLARLDRGVTQFSLKPLAILLDAEGNVLRSSHAFGAGAWRSICALDGKHIVTEASGRKDAEHEWRSWHHDQETTWSTLTISDPDGKPAFVVVTGFLRERGTPFLRTRSDTFEPMFLAEMPMPMWVFDRATFRLLAVNDVVVRRTGYARDELLSMRVTDLHPWEDLPAFLSAVVSGDERTDVRWQHRRRDGAVIEVEGQMSTTISAGRPACVAVWWEVPGKNG